MRKLGTVRLAPHEIVLNGAAVFSGSLNEAYRTLAGDYPKFFKMDGMCKAGFLGAELLLKDFTKEEKENAAVILFGRAGSLAADRNYQTTISDPANYFPSPALFVYTLANIVTGEIAIRHKIYGETSFYILDSKQSEEMESIVREAFLTSSPDMILTGWVDYENENDYLAELELITKQ